MRLRTAAVASAALPLLLLTACDPGGSPVPTGSPSPPVSATDAPPAEIPEDAVLVLTGTATTGSATADFRLVVHAPAPYDADGAADGWAATTDWCPGEVDDDVVSSQDFSFTAIDVSLTPISGTWPAETTLLVLPLPGPGSTIAVSGDLVQVDEPTEFGQESPVPHCAQPALLGGPGEGTLYLGIPGDKVGAEDGPPFTAWADRKYGLNSHLPGELGTENVTFSGCSVTITDLGQELGAPTEQWEERLQADFCVVGGATGGE